MRGFTLIEILITIALIGIISFFGVLSLGNFRRQQDLDNAANSIVAVLRDAQNRAITQEDGKAWGLRFNNSLYDTYTLFSGTIFGAPISTTTLGSNLEFRIPATGVLDINFEQITGFWNAAGSENSVIIKIGVKGIENASTTIMIFKNGRIEKK